jgi:hypothetical protein
MKKDEAISQIRRVRHVISLEHGHDPKTLVNYYIELQKKYPQLFLFQNNIKEVVQAK